MLETVLVKNNVALKTRITVKTLVSVLIVVCAVLLPQLVHAAAGQAGGMQWLPMYLPVIIGACLLGWRWGLGVGLISPLVSFLVTLPFGTAMPTAIRLPYMMAELGVDALIAGMFSKKITENSLVSFAAVVLAFAGGRLAFLAIAAVFGSISPIGAAVALSQIQSGFAGMILQIVVAPIVIMGLKKLLIKDDK